MICTPNELADRLKGMAVHVNLIPVNPVKERGFKRDRQRIEVFQKALEKRDQCDHPARLGAALNAACDSCAESMTSRTDSLRRWKRSDSIGATDTGRQRHQNQDAYICRRVGEQRICHRL